jgi:hypothetical protein
MINENNYDMWIAIAFCYLPIIPILVLAYISSKSGSKVKQHKPGTPPWIYEWVNSDVNVPFVKTGWFKFAVLWLVLGTLFFFGMLWPDHQDIWFEPVSK